MSRTRPTKETTPPMSWRPLVSCASSRPGSKSSCWTRITSASRHRRGEGELPVPADGGVERHVLLVHGDAHDGCVLERFRMAGRLRLQPVEQGAHRSHIGRQCQRLLALADARTQPGEVEQLHATTSLNGRKSTI